MSLRTPLPLPVPAGGEGFLGLGWTQKNLDPPYLHSPIVSPIFAYFHGTAYFRGTMES